MTGPSCNVHPCYLLEVSIITVHVPYYINYKANFYMLKLLIQRTERTIIRRIITHRTGIDGKHLIS